ncbi:hypothetical protein A374_01404 [Fictibacillus macauensis ZFHKF-1]|uniref:LXG domain-containing protein n=1 Tax=Fictibacillus macauensis ZFHKF-1 TaxID=1196324 RepID=I8AMJ8_9BACL|nr:hypothetical protein [Fictibacillus macauensis]EIT87212.1 hypothetical protein A374_01404 [Fictibacillus macauensis ZFHKF-1]
MEDIYKYESNKNQYGQLHNQIKEALEAHKGNLKEVKALRDTYFSLVPNLGISGIPSKFVEPKLKGLDDELKKFIKQMEEKTVSLESARDQAYKQYEHYKKLCEDSIA